MDVMGVEEIYQGFWIDLLAGATFPDLDYLPSACRPPPRRRPARRTAAPGPGRSAARAPPRGRPASRCRAAQHPGTPRPPAARSLPRRARRARPKRVAAARTGAVRRRIGVRRRRGSAAARPGAPRKTELAVYRIRRATAADAGVLARHRAEMFRDMGELPASVYDTLIDAARAYLTQAITDGRYVGWVAELDAGSREVVGGAGLQLRELLPRPDVARERLVRGPQGLIVNVYTERAWRRKGGADALMRELLQWCRGNGIESVVLHASDDGRPLYEKLGFRPTNEMRYDGGA